MISCKLCYIPEKDIIWKDGDFFGTKKRKNFIIVYRFHKKQISFLEKKESLKLIKKYWPDKKPRNKGVRTNKDHWHEYIIDK